MMMFNKLLAPDRHINNRWHPPQTTLTTSLVYFFIHYELYSCFKKDQSILQNKRNNKRLFFGMDNPGIKSFSTWTKHNDCPCFYQSGNHTGFKSPLIVWSQSYCVVTFGQARQKRDKTGIAGWVVCWDGGGIEDKTSRRNSFSHSHS